MSWGEPDLEPERIEVTLEASRTGALEITLIAVDDAVLEQLYPEGTVHTEWIGWSATHTIAAVTRTGTGRERRARVRAAPNGDGPQGQPIAALPASEEVSDTRRAPRTVRAVQRGIADAATEDARAFAQRATLAALEVSASAAELIDTAFPAHTTALVGEGETTPARVARLSEAVNARARGTITAYRRPDAQAWTVAGRRDADAAEVTLGAGWTLYPEGCAGRWTAEAEMDPALGDPVLKVLTRGPRERSDEQKLEGVPTGLASVRSGTRTFETTALHATLDTRLGAPDAYGTRRVEVTGLRMRLTLEALDERVPALVHGAPRVVLGKIAAEPSPGEVMIAVEPARTADTNGIKVPDPDPDYPQLRAATHWEADEGTLHAVMAGPAFERKEGPGIYVGWEPGDGVLVLLAMGALPTALGAPRQEWAIEAGVAVHAKWATIVHTDREGRTGGRITVSEGNRALTIGKQVDLEIEDK